MSDSGSGVVGVEVESLHSTGGTIAGRAGHGHAAAKGLKEGLDAAHGSVGHPVVRAALSAFVTTDITDNANKLGTQLTSGGHNVSNVAATARDSDEDGARGLTPGITETTAIDERINRQV